MNNLKTGQMELDWDIARGCYIESNGVKYFDWTSGAITANAGHGCESIELSINKAVKSGVLHSYSFQNHYKKKLEDLLKKMTGYGTCLFYSSGTEAIEAAIKLCKHGKISNRKNILSFKGSFHGRSMGAQLVGGIDQQKKWLKESPEYIHLTFPECEDSFKQFERELSGIDLSNILFLIYEPFRGSFIDRPLTKALKLLEQKRKQYGFYTICDEVQSGVYRTGSFLASKEFPIQNDFLILSKGLSSSLPLSAVLTKSIDNFNVEHGMITSSNGGNPICCAAAIGSVEFLTKYCSSTVFKEACDCFRFEMNKLSRNPEVMEVFSWGLMGGIKLRRDFSYKFQESMFGKHSLVFKPVGIEKKIKLCPPLIVNKEQLMEEFAKITEVMGELCEC